MQISLYKVILDTMVLTETSLRTYSCYLSIPVKWETKCLLKVVFFTSSGNITQWFVNIAIIISHCITSKMWPIATMSCLQYIASHLSSLKCSSNTANSVSMYQLHIMMCTNCCLNACTCFWQIASISSLIAGLQEQSFSHRSTWYSAMGSVCK